MNMNLSFNKNEVGIVFSELEKTLKEKYSLIKNIKEKENHRYRSIESVEFLEFKDTYSIEYMYYFRKT
jgi:hypothetical protein